jgi:hypothetical protein
MTIDPLILRALNYPYSYPEYDFVLDNGSAAPLQDRKSLEGRIPVLAIGSNRSPEQLLRKFGDQDFLPVTFIKLYDYDVVYAAHMASYGSIPAVLAPSSGTIVDIAITWLSKLQLKRMHETEAIGINYDYGVANSLKINADYDYKNQDIGCYLGRRGCLNIMGNVIALKEITATKRVFSAFSQSEILKKIWLNEQKEIQFEVWLKSLIQNKEARQSITTAFEQTAIVNVLPAFEVFTSEGL